MKHELRQMREQGSGDAQGAALSSLTWKIRGDFRARLKAGPPRVQLSVPNWATGVAHDSKLWIAWASFEAAFSRAGKHLLFLADPDEAEASQSRAQGAPIGRSAHRRPRLRLTRPD